MSTYHMVPFDYKTKLKKLSRSRSSKKVTTRSSLKLFDTEGKGYEPGLMNRWGLL